LEHGDLSMGMVHGVFSPEPGYKNVQDVFLLFSKEKHDEYYKRRDGLNLVLQDKEGKCVPTEFIHIIDCAPELDELSIEILLKNPSEWSDNAIT